MRIKRRTYTRTISDNIAENPESHSERRQKNMYQETYIYTYNESQYSRTLMRIFREQGNKYHDEEKYTQIQ